MPKISATIQREVKTHLTQQLKVSQVFILPYPDVDNGIVVKALRPRTPFDQNLSILNAYKAVKKIEESLLLNLIDARVLPDAPDGHWALEIIYIIPTS